MMVFVLRFVSNDDEFLWCRTESAFIEPESCYGGANEEEVATNANKKDKEEV
jgi:hypothetical protein